MIQIPEGFGRGGSRKNLIILLLTSLLISIVYISMCHAQRPFIVSERYDFLPSWDISGENTFHWDWYRNEGDKDSSFYPNGGTHLYDDIVLNFSRQVSPYEVWRGRFNGVWNDSDYRSDDRGFIPENFSLFWEKGNSKVPFRVELGDFFGFYTYRTLQRSLKGIQVELQPKLSKDYDVGNSIMITAGTAGLQDYDRGAINDDFYKGISWLVHTHSSNLLLNYIHNYRHADPMTATPRRSQHVVSAGMNHSHTIFKQDLKLEGEVSHFEGDLPDTGELIERNKEDMAYFFQLRGKSQIPLTYILRFEDYGQDFRPNGGVVTADRRTYSTKFGYRLAKGLNLNTRVQRYIDGRDAGNATTTDVIGFGLNGPLTFIPIKGLNVYMDLFTQSAENEDLSVNSETHSGRVDISTPIKEGLTGRVNLSSQAVKDQVNKDKTDTREVNLSVTSIFKIGQLSGGITPGVFLRTIKAFTPSAEDDYGFNLALNLANAKHNLNINYSFTQEDPHGVGQIDIRNHAINSIYSYASGPHSVGLQFDLSKRCPHEEQASVGYHVGIFYTFRFRKPSKESRKTEKLYEEEESKEAEQKREQRFAIGDIKPGIKLKDAIKVLEEFGIKGGTKLPGVVVYEVSVFEEISQRQRFAIVHDKDIVKKTALIVDLEDVGDPDTAWQIYEKIRKSLIQQYGMPSTYNKGSFSGDLSGDINTERVIRISEWIIDGGVLRLGFPRRLDKTVRIELQFATSFPSPLITTWSIESVQ